MQQQGSKYFARKHSYSIRMGSIGQKSTSTEHGHVAYQIRVMMEMQHYGNIYLASRPPLPHGP